MQKFHYSFLYLLGLEDQCNATEDVDIFLNSSSHGNRRRTFSEVSITVSITSLDKNSFWKSLEASARVCS